MPQYAAIIYSRDVDWTAPEYADGWPPSTPSSARPRPPSSAAAPRSTRRRRATTVRVSEKGGDVITTDGPYAETKEVLTGFYLLECADLDEAIAAGRARSPAPGTARSRCGRSSTSGCDLDPSADGDERPSRPDPAGPRVGARRARHPGPGDRRPRRWPRTPCRTPWSARSRPGRATASPPTRSPGCASPRGAGPSTSSAARRPAGRRRQRPWTRRRPADERARPASMVEDDLLRLVFTCCHPSLAPATQVALALRTLCGLTTAEVARALLVSEASMAKRLTRARQKIKQARIPYRVPPDHELPDRWASVLATTYLLFNEGYAATDGPDLVRRRAGRRGDPARPGCWSGSSPTTPGALGLLALMLLQDSRRAARVDADGGAVLLADQDRSRWDARQDRRRACGSSARGCAARRTARTATSSRPRSPRATRSRPTYDATDWDAVVSWYDVLLTLDPGPVVRLNRAAAVGRARRRPPPGSPRSTRCTGSTTTRSGTRPAPCCCAGSGRDAEADAADRPGRRAPAQRRRSGGCWRPAARLRTGNARRTARSGRAGRPRRARTSPALVATVPSRPRWWPSR